jgi:glycosyltransferase involved in cell wall biosynthesis
MRVLYLIDSLVPSGAERSLAALAPAYAARGISLDVAYLHDRPGIQDELEAAGADLFCLAGPGGRLGWAIRARNLILRRRPDLVHTTLIEADLVGRVASRVAGTPVVGSWVNPYFGPQHLHHPGFPSWKVRIGLSLDRWSARWVTRFHAISGYIAEVMGRTLGVAGERIDVVPRGRDPAAIGQPTPDRRRKARATLGVADDELLLLTVARQDRQKGLDVLVEAMPSVLSRFPKARLVMVGREGNMTGLLRRRIHDHGLEAAVSSIGPRSDVLDLLCGADLFVFPSRWEGLGSVLLEVLALEVPIVASDIPPVREVVGEGVATLVPPERQRELSAALISCLADPHAGAARARMGRQRFLDRFTIDRVADGMANFYARALGG